MDRLARYLVQWEITSGNFHCPRSKFVGDILGWVTGGVSIYAVCAYRRIYAVRAY